MLLPFAVFQHRATKVLALRIAWVAIEGKSYAIVRYLEGGSDYAFEADKFQKEWQEITKSEDLA